MVTIFTSISDVAKAEYKDKGSRFIAVAMPFFHEEELNGCLDTIRIQYPKASHYCYAYRLGTEGLRYRANDDGEPSGSAGRPILAAIDSAGLTHLIVIVVRYFGGTKLGVPGLIHAYRAAAELALAAAERSVKEYRFAYRITFGYTAMGPLLNVLKELHIPITEKHFTESGLLSCHLPLATHNEVIAKIKATLLGVSTEQINETTTLIDCTIEPLGLFWMDQA